jgi:hypothetical protein
MSETKLRNRRAPNGKLKHKSKKHKSNVIEPLTFVPAAAVATIQHDQELSDVCLKTNFMVVF